MVATSVRWSAGLMRSGGGGFKRFMYQQRSLMRPMLMKSHLIGHFGTCTRKNRETLVSGPNHTHCLRYPRVAAIFLAIERK